MAWIDKLVDIVMGGLPGTALALVPEHIKKQWAARVRDHDPFKQISLNHDLRRATRLAWIEAALALIEGVVVRTHVTSDFKRLVVSDLRKERNAALDSSNVPVPSPIDRAVLLLINGVSEHVATGATGRSSVEITESFTNVLAEITGWHKSELPPEIIAAASRGLVRGGLTRSFGELAFDAFASTLKEPGAYPQAQAAFQIAMQNLEQDLSRSILVQIGGLNAKVDEALLDVDATQAFRRGLSEHMATMTRVAGDVEATRSLAETLEAAPKRVE